MDENNKKKRFGGCTKYIIGFIILLIFLSISFAAGAIVHRQYFVPIAETFQCEYNNGKYKLDSSFTSTDGCNTCSCTADGVACTDMACNVDVIGSDIYSKKSFPVVFFENENYLSSAEYEHVTERVVEPIKDFYQDEESDLINIILVIPMSEEDKIIIELYFLDGRTSFSEVSGKVDNDLWWKPDCPFGCNFSDDFKQKYPEIVN